GEYWKLWTTLFVHADIGHALSNAFLFFILGFFLYGYYGIRVFPLAALFWGGITNLFVLLQYESDIHLIGASGVVYWMGGFWLTLYFLLNRKLSLFPRALRTIGVGLIL